ncbi:hypothetical protein QO012_004134 [Methylobacterium aerolatum]|uniref:Uncharacterized protein n=1 Tax=Methylobacterium aerolatum TaxID=418708 RepID=A0ABU0I4Q9_9HYPH|nr:hypothetical protein [Methylobacterium aerolatum]GJD36099.1 hypothetical protein FMGBMHLM_3013 [Methylobacterium aerolatum]
MTAGTRRDLPSSAAVTVLLRGIRMTNRTDLSARMR